MWTVDLSIIFPVRNIENEISAIVRHLNLQASTISCELIIVDMGSDDMTVVTALQVIQRTGINGCVVQNGLVSPADALNSGLQKARGKYITFLFARRIYGDVIADYFTAAETSEADIVFGSSSLEDSRIAERLSVSKVVKNKQGPEYLTTLLEEKLSIDIASVLIRRKFLVENHIWFHENCLFGYADEFLYRCLLYGQEVVQSPVIPQRIPQLEMPSAKVQPVGPEIFQEIEAMLRVRDLFWCEQSGDSALLEAMDFQRIPRAVMHCIDVLLLEGLPRATVQKELKDRSYHHLLRIGKPTLKPLKKKILLWKMPLRHYHPY